MPVAIRRPRLEFGNWSWTLIGPRAAWTFFLATCLHLTFLQPYLILWPGNPINLFSTAVCGLALLLTLLVHRDALPGWRSPSIWLSMILVGLPLLSAAFSPTVGNSLARVLAMAFSGLSGFWCARLLLQDDGRRRFFIRFMSLVLAVVVLLLLLGVVLKGHIYPFLDTHKHPTGNRLLLFSFAPLALLLTPSKKARIVGGILLLLAYGGLLLAGKYDSMKSVALIVPAVVALGACLGPPRRWLLVTLALMTLTTSAIMVRTLAQNASDLDKRHVSVAYRLENIYFSYKIATDHPWLGLGLLAPRDEELIGYQPRYAYINRNDFNMATKALKTSENTVLTFAADLGFPLVTIYVLALLGLTWRLAGQTFRDPPETVLPALAMILPIIAGWLHLQFFDGLLQPHVSYFFHLLLGLASTASVRGPSWPEAKTMVSRGLFLVLAMGLGLGLGLIL